MIRAMSTVAPLGTPDGQGDAYVIYSYSADAADVEVDVRTGEVKVHKIYAAYDVGIPGSATLILRDDELPTVTITAADADASEPQDPAVS